MFSDRKNKRILILAGFVLAFALLVFIQLSWVQLLDGKKLKNIADNRGKSKIRIEPQRGIIYDRKGLPLTENLSDYTKLSVNKYYLIKPNLLIADLEKITGRTSDYFWRKLDSQSGFVTIANKLSPKQVAAIERRGWNLYKSEDISRIYPYKKTAAQLIGFLSVDNYGISAIEMVYDDVLRGEPGWRVVEVDVHGNLKYRQKLPYQPPVNGGDIVLTIDVNIQTILEEELAIARRYHNAASASGLIMNPQTGEIYAMATVEGFDANDPHAYPEENQRNRAVCDLMEFGSTFKAISAALLLEHGYVSTNTMIDTEPGYIVVHGKRIDDTESHGLITFSESIEYSSNVAMIKMFEKISPEKIYNFVDRFGFFEETGIELTGEVTALLLKPENWSGTTKSNVVIGQGIAASMLSLAQAYQIICNNGKIVKPRLVYGIRYPDGRSELFEPRTGKQIISEATADTLVNIFERVVKNGTAQQAAIKGIRVAAKTGTAQKPNLETGGYYKDRYLSNLVGFFPVEDPKYLMMVAIDEPRRNGYYASQCAAPAFRRIGEKLTGFDANFNKSGLYNKKSGDSNIKLEDYCSLRKSEAAARLNKNGLKANYTGRGEFIYDQSIPPGVMVEKGTRIKLTLGSEGLTDLGNVIVPILTDFSLRDAIYKATKAGLTVKCLGSGRVVNQSIKCGSKVKLGELCVLRAE